MARWPTWRLRTQVAANFPTRYAGFKAPTDCAVRRRPPIQVGRDLGRRREPPGFLSRLGERFHARDDITNKQLPAAKVNLAGGVHASNRSSYVANAAFISWRWRGTAVLASSGASYLSATQPW